MSVVFPKMADILVPGTRCEATLEHFTVSREDSMATAIRAIQHPEAYVAAGTYVKLTVDDTLMMTDTYNKQRTNMGVVKNARGRVFIAGLGLGMILHPIAEKTDVKQITVVEQSQGVIDLVASTLPKKVKIVHEDVFELKLDKAEKFETIYFDIWPHVTADNLPAMARLHRRFKKYLADGGWMESWCRSETLAAWERYKLQRV